MVRARKDGIKQAIEGELFRFDIDFRSLIDRSDYWNYRPEDSDGEDSGRTIDPIRVRYKIIDDETTATRNVDFVAPKTTLSTTNFNAEDIFLASQTNGIGRIYIPILSDDIVEQDETVTIKLIPDSIIVPRECLNCHRIHEPWKYLKQSRRGFNNLNRVGKDGAFTKTKDYQAIFDEIINVIKIIRSGDTKDLEIVDGGIEQVWSGFITFPSSNKFRIRNTIDPLLSNLVATSISLGCETDTAASTLDYEIKADRQVPFKYRFNLNIEEIEKLSDEKLDQIEKLNDAFELEWKNIKADTEYRQIDPHQHISRQRHSWSNGDYINLDQAEEIREIAGGEYEIRKFEPIISPKREFATYSLADSEEEIKATVNIVDDGKFTAALIGTPHKIPSPRPIQAFQEDSIHQAIFDIHLTSRPQESVNVILKTKYSIDQITNSNVLQKVEDGYELVISPENWDKVNTLKIQGIPQNKFYKLNLIANSGDLIYDKKEFTLDFIPSKYFENNPIGSTKPVVTIFEDGQSQIITTSNSNQKNNNKTGNQTSGDDEIGSNGSDNPITPQVELSSSVDEINQIRLFQKNTVGESIVIGELKPLDLKERVYEATLKLMGGSNYEKAWIPKDTLLEFEDDFGNHVNFKLVEKTEVLYRNYAGKGSQNKNTVVHQKARLELVSDDINPNIKENIESSFENKENVFLTALYDIELASLGDTDTIEFVHEDYQNSIDQRYFINLHKKPKDEVIIYFPDFIDKEKYGSLRILSKGDIALDENGRKYISFGKNNWDKPQEFTIRSRVENKNAAEQDLFNLGLELKSTDPDFKDVIKDIAINKNVQDIDEKLSSVNEKDETKVNVGLTSATKTVFKEGSSSKEFVLSANGLTRRGRGVDVKLEVEEITKNYDRNQLNKPYINGTGGRERKGLISTLRLWNTDAEPNSEIERQGIDGSTFNDLWLFRNPSLLKTAQERFDSLYRRNHGYLRVPSEGYYSFKLNPKKEGEHQLVINQNILIQENTSQQTIDKAISYTTHALFSGTDPFEISISYTDNNLGRSTDSEKQLEASKLQWKKPGDTEYSDIPSIYFSPISDGHLFNLTGRGTQNRAVFNLNVEDDLHDSDKREFAIKIVPLAKGGCNVNTGNRSETVQNLCETTKTNSSKIEQTYDYDDYELKIHFNNISLPNGENNATGYLSDRIIKADLEIELPDNYKDYERHGGINIPSLTKLFISNLQSDQGFYFEAIDEIRIEEDKINNGSLKIKNYRLRSEYNLFSHIRKHNVDSLSSTHALVSPYRVTIKENDQAGYTFLDSDHNASSEGTKIIEGEPDEIRMAIKLNSKPSNYVKIRLESQDFELLGLRNIDAHSTELNQRIELNFTQSNWDKPQEFIYKAKDNDFINKEELQEVEIQASVSSEDPRFNEIDTSGQSVFNKKDTKAIESVLEDDELSQLDESEIVSLHQEGDPKKVKQELRKIGYKVQSNGPLTVNVKDDDEVGIIAAPSNSGVISESSRGYVDLSLTTQPKDDVVLTLKPPTHYDLLLTSSGIEDLGNNRYMLTSDIFNISADESIGGKFPYLIANNSLDLYDNQGNVARFLVTKDIDFVLPKVNESKSVEIPVELIGKSEILDLNGISDRDTLNGAFTSRPQFKFENYLLPEQVSINIDRDNWNEPHRIYIDAISDTLPESLSRQPIQITSKSEDSNYNNLKNQAIHVEVVDNDVPEARLVLVHDGTEHSGPARFRIELDHPAPFDSTSKGIKINYKLSVDEIDPRIKYAINGDKPRQNSKLTDDELYNYNIQYPTTRTHSVRIPAGQLFSEEFIVPIDDFVADKVDKKIKIQLSKDQSDSYSISNTENTIRAEIKNNDKAGLLLIYPGDFIRVSEEDDGAVVLAQLTSQPMDDVIVSYEEIYSKESPLDQISPKQLESGGTVSFNSNNWFVPRPLLISAINDNIVEDRTKTGHDLVRYGRMESDYSDDILDTIPYRYLYNEDTNSALKIVTPEHDLDKTGYHPARIKFNVESCDDDYQNIAEQIAEIEVIDAEVPAQTTQLIVEQFANTQTIASDVDIPNMDDLSHKDTQDSFESVNDFQESVEEIDYQTPSAVNKALSDSLNGSSSTTSNDQQGSSNKKKERGRNSEEEKEILKNFVPTNETLDAYYHKEDNVLTLSNLSYGQINYNNKSNTWLLDPQSLEIIVQDSNKNIIDKYVLTTTEQSQHRVVDSQVREQEINGGKVDLKHDHIAFDIQLNANDTFKFSQILHQLSNNQDQKIFIKGASDSTIPRFTVLQRKTDGSESKLSLEENGANTSIQNAQNSAFNHQINSPSELSITADKEKEEFWQLRNQFKAQTGLKYNKEWRRFETNVHFKWLAKHRIFEFGGQLDDLGIQDLGLNGEYIIQAGVDLYVGTATKQNADPDIGTAVPGGIQLREAIASSRNRTHGFSSNISQRLIDNHRDKHEDSNRGLDRFSLPPISEKFSQFAQSHQTYSYLSADKTAFKTGVSFEPQGGINTRIGPPEAGVSVRLENYNCTKQLCKEMADDEDGIGSGLAINALIGLDPKSYILKEEGEKYTEKYDVKENILKLSDLKENPKDSLIFDVVYEKSLAFKVTTGISTHQDNPSLSSFPRFLPSLEAGFAYKYDDVSMIDESRKLWSKFGPAAKPKPPEPPQGPPEDPALIGSPTKPEDPTGPIKPCYNAGKGGYLLRNPENPGKSDPDGSFNSKEAAEPCEPEPVTPEPIGGYVPNCFNAGHGGYLLRNPENPDWSGPDGSFNRYLLRNPKNPGWSDPDGSFNPTETTGPCEPKPDTPPSPEPIGGVYNFIQVPNNCGKDKDCFPSEIASGPLAPNPSLEPNPSQSTLGKIKQKINLKPFTRWVFHDAKVDLGDFATSSLAPFLKNTDEALSPIYPTMDVLYGEIGFFRAFDPSVVRFLDADRNGKVSLTDIVLTVARALAAREQALNSNQAQSSPRTNLCYAASALVQFGSYLDTFRLFVQRNADIARKNDKLDRLNSEYNFGFKVPNSKSNLLNLFQSLQEYDKPSQDRNPSIQQIPLVLQLSQREASTVAHKDILTIPKGTKGTFQLSNGRTSYTEFPIKMEALDRHKRQKNDLSNEVFFQQYNITDRDIADSAAYKSLIGYLTTTLIDGDHINVQRLNSVSEDPMFHSKVVTLNTPAKGVSPTHQAALYLLLDKYQSDYKELTEGVSDLTRSITIEDTYKPIFDIAGKAKGLSWNNFFDAQLSPSQYLLYRSAKALYDKLYSVYSNKFDQNSNQLQTEYINLVSNKVAALIPVLEHYLSDPTQNRLGQEASKFAEQFSKLEEHYKKYKDSDNQIKIQIKIQIRKINILEILSIILIQHHLLMSLITIDHGWI